jgi:hypothetical protein
MVHVQSASQLLQSHPYLPQLTSRSGEARHAAIRGMMSTSGSPHLEASSPRTFLDRQSMTRLPNGLPAWSWAMYGKLCAAYSGTSMLQTWMVAERA